MGGLQIQTGLYDEVVRIQSLNGELERGARYHVMEEEWLAARMSELEAVAHPSEDAYWLTMARIAELALFCAGNYADGGLLREVGDLMFNPRTVLVHIRGRAAPVRKKRHELLTAQFRDWAGDDDVVSWLKNHTMNEIREEPIVPVLREALKSGGRMTDAYLESLDTRACRIADAIRQVSIALNATDDFELYLQTMDETDRRFVESRLCRFDLDRFRELGNEICAAGLYPAYQSRFMKPLA